MNKYVDSMILEGKKIMTEENKLRFQVGLEPREYVDKGLYIIGQYNHSSNELIIKALKMGKYIPVTLVQKNESLQRCITNESCYYLNISKRNELEQMYCNNIQKYIDFYNSVMDASPFPTEEDNLLI